MPARRLSVMATGALLALTACGGGGSAVVGDPPRSSLATSATSPSATPSASGSAHYRRHHPPSSTPTPTPKAATTAPLPATLAPRASTTASRPATKSPSPTHSSSPSHHPSPSASAPCAGVTGSTTTVQEQAGDKFVPSTVAISRCDSVQAVYSDTTGARHTFTGPGWDSGDMSSTGRTSYTYQFVSKGTFSFYCTYHERIGMTGTITVS